MRLLLDTSGSMSMAQDNGLTLYRNVLEASLQSTVKELAETAIDRQKKKALDPTNRTVMSDVCFVVNVDGFSSELTRNIIRPIEFTGDDDDTSLLAKLKAAQTELMSYPLRGSTRLYDSVVETMQLMTESVAVQIGTTSQIVLLVSDGDDTCSRNKALDMKLASESAESQGIKLIVVACSDTSHHTRDALSQAAVGDGTLPTFGRSCSQSVRRSLRQASYDAQGLMFQQTQFSPMVPLLPGPRGQGTSEGDTVTYVAGTDQGTATAEIDLLGRISALPTGGDSGVGGRAAARVYERV